MAVHGSIGELFCRRQSRRTRAQQCLEVENLLGSFCELPQVRYKGLKASTYENTDWARCREELSKSPCLHPPPYGAGWRQGAPDGDRRLHIMGVHFQASIEPSGAIWRPLLDPPLLMQFDCLLLYLYPPFSDSGRNLTSRFCMVLVTMCESFKGIC